ncbi:MAG: DNA methylase [Oscillospiraceae bacterium]|nr:DNA methylase [Oscillospiraceae bacterium]
MEEKVYIAIDLKSFYASVECIERGLDPMRTCLVVADSSRTEKTICLAVSPALKRFGVPGRPRLFEVVQIVKEVNARRLQQAPGHTFTGASDYAPGLSVHPELALDYIVAPPRMAHYIDYSTRIYNVYLKHAAPEDIHVYSIDEVFIDATRYLNGRPPREFAMEIVLDVLDTTGITATAGIGTNLYLAKVAMDIVAKHSPADRNGVRIAELNEMSYREQLWNHRPLTDFWRIGRGYAKKLEANGMFTMGDIARCSIGRETDFYNEELLYRLFGINAELLIDHAWGWEPTTIADIKSYRPSTNSISTGQVLHCAYTAEKARLITREMADLMVYDLVDKRLVTDQLVLTIGYDIENLADPERSKRYHGDVKVDFYGRKVPKHAHGTIHLGKHSSSTKEIMQAVTELYDRIVDPNLLVRRINICANHLLRECDAPQEQESAQLDLFTDYEALEQQRAKEAEALEREKRMQHTLLNLKKKYGKNAVFKGMNLEEGATALDRNRQIGGHKA